MKSCIRTRPPKLIKFFLVIILIPMLLVTYSPAIAKAITSLDSQWEYTVDSNNQITITKYTGNASSLTIPSYIDGKNVVSIGVNAFLRYDPVTYRTTPNTTLITLQISEGIKSIQTGAFGNCTSLVSVQTPSTLESIGDTAFFNCTSLLSINLGNNLQNIGERAFFGTALTSVNIPASVTTMGLNPFSNCSNLSTLTVDSQNQNFTAVDNVLFNKNKSQLLIYPNGKAGTNYVIPDGVTSIGGNAFFQNHYLSTVSFPENLTSIGANAFGSSGITSISLPDSVTEILNGAFSKCCNLTTVELSRNLQKIDIWAFFGCPITTIDFPYHLNSIGEGAFQDNSSLTTARFYGEQPTIGNDAFLHPSANFSLQYNKEYASSWSGYNGTPFTVAPLGITFKSSITNLSSGSQQKLQAVLLPSWIPEQSLTWSSDNTSIASIDNNGLVTAGAIGTTTIHVSTANGKTAQCNINVIPPITSADGNWTYQTNSNNEISIISYNGQSQTITVPATIDGKIVTSINDKAFSNDSITTISIPASLINIGNDALTGSTLQSIQVDSNNPVYASENGVLYSKNYSTLVRYPAGKLDSNFTIKDQVISIEPYAFSNAKNLINITLPERLTEIENGTFANCSGLSSITIPASVTMIQPEAFSGCTSLTGIELSYYIRNIGEKAFSGCTSLQQATFIGEMPTMGSNIFTGVASGFRLKYNGKYASTWTAGYENLTLETVNIGASSISLVDSYQTPINYAYIKTSESKQLSAVVSPFWVTDPSVTWSSTDSKVATVSNTGLVQGVNGGTATITATTSYGKSAQCIVTVAASVNSIELNKTALTLHSGDAASITATVYPTNAVDKYLFWTSSNNNVATVSNNGQINAMAIGTATITVSTTNNLSKTCTVTVVPATPNGTSTPPSADVPKNTEPSASIRIQGSDRMDTAANIANSCYSGMVNDIVLTTAYDFPDALSGSTYAAKIGAPILSVGYNSKDSLSTFKYIVNHLKKCGTVHILGGAGAVGGTIEDYLKASGYNVDRIYGNSRYETAKAICDRIAPAAGTPVFLAVHDNYPDALSASAIAGNKGYPILLTMKSALPDATYTELQKVQPSKVYIVGGTGVISDGIKAQIKSAVPRIQDINIIRIAGANRFETSVAVAKYFNLNTQNALIATGYDFPDALAGSVLGAKLNAPMILVGHNTSEITSQKQYLDSTSIQNLYILGGNGAIPENIVQQLKVTVHGS